MTVIQAKHAFLPQGWVDDVQVKIADGGQIESVHTRHKGGSSAIADHETGILLPAPVNVHSHAFQRAIAGLTEARGNDPKDSFWTWRKCMYRFLERLTPDHVEAITAFAQMEMLESGFASVAEFHYLHHQLSGAPYGNPAEMAQRVMAAGSNTGIGLTLLPVLYQYGGCDRRDLSGSQIRFGNNISQFELLFEMAGAAIKNLPEDAVLGVAAHSLRAVAPESLTDLVTLAGNRPVHMHLAEQVAEVEEVKAAWGKRPAEWLLDHLKVSRNWCLVHITQMEPHEILHLAGTGAVAGLCPITEASLGDGIFDGVRWLGAGGQIAIGSDSNIRISLTEELRLLEYSQRLRDRARAVLASNGKTTGRRLFEAVASGGAQAAGRHSGAIKQGVWADLLALDLDAADFSGRTGDQVFDSYIFSGGDKLVTDVWSAGRHMVQGGAHVHRQKIESRYKRVMAELGEAL